MVRAAASMAARADVHAEGASTRSVRASVSTASSCRSARLLSNQACRGASHSVCSAACRGFTSRPVSESTRLTNLSISRLGDDTTFIDDPSVAGSASPVTPCRVGFLSEQWREQAVDEIHDRVEGPIGIDDSDDISPCALSDSRNLRNSKILVRICVNPCGDDLACSVRPHPSAGSGVPVVARIEDHLEDVYPERVQCGSDGLQGTRIASGSSSNQHVPQTTLGRGRLMSQSCGMPTPFVAGPRGWQRLRQWPSADACGRGRSLR